MSHPQESRRLVVHRHNAGGLSPAASCRRLVPAQYEMESYLLGRMVRRQHGCVTRGGARRDSWGMA
jgi:hypothetical protein